jgi:hypothetical protein
MSDANPLLGFTADHHAPPRDEEDQKERSSKKIKGGDKEDAKGADKGETLNVGEQREKVTTIGSKSYKESVAGVMVIDDEEELRRGKSRQGEEVFEENEFMVEGQIEEQRIGDIECPKFSFSLKEEQRIQRPWKQGVIVQLLGRKIGYKALENRLKQLWVRKGAIQIVDLSHDFYLVTFTSLEDQCRALTEGPWMIYDHYLVVRAWSSNFDPSTATVSKTAVWVRFSGLPIEYYDPRILHFIGNRIGTTVKVDKNTLLQERGKYARLCVEVDLSKPLLAMFELKGRHYKVEYEGLHLLCLKCGRYDHLSAVCPEKLKTTDGSTGGGTNIGIGGETTEQIVEGPWTVVHKPRRARKGKEGSSLAQSADIQNQPEKTTAAVGKTGSRFAVLTAKNAQESILAENSETVTNVDMGKSFPSLPHNDMRERNIPKSTNERNKGNANSNKIKKITATRASFKEKVGPTHGKINDTLADLMVSNALDACISNQYKPMNKIEKLPMKNNVDHQGYDQGQAAVQNFVELHESQNSDQTHLFYHRDPGLKESKFFHGPMFDDRRPVLEDTLSLHPKNNGSRSLEVEVFVDAKENGDSSAEEWDMDIAVEGANQVHAKEEGKGNLY